VALENWKISRHSGLHRFFCWMAYDAHDAENSGILPAQLNVFKAIVGWRHSWLLPKIPTSARPNAREYDTPMDWEHHSRHCKAITRRHQQQGLHPKKHENAIHSYTARLNKEGLLHYSSRRATTLPHQIHTIDHLVDAMRDLGKHVRAINCRHSFRIGAHDNLVQYLWRSSPPLGAPRECCGSKSPPGFGAI
jgi:hypothetical protein